MMYYTRKTFDLPTTSSSCCCSVTRSASPFAHARHALRPSEANAMSGRKQVLIVIDPHHWPTDVFAWTRTVLGDAALCVRNLSAPTSEDTDR